MPRATGLRLFADPTNCPLSPSSWSELVAAAGEAWSRASTGVSFIPASGLRDADVIVGFRAREHAGCRPFRAADGEIAHAGPTTLPSFVHLLEDAVFRESGGVGEAPRLDLVVLHELGHVLGLDHPGTGGAVMSASYRDLPARLTAADLAGLRSLYGGGEASPGDVLICDLGDDLRPLAPRVGLRRLLAAADRFAVFDADADARDELLAWTAPEEKLRALRRWSFDSAGRLAKSHGPFHGLLSHRVEISLSQSEGDRLLIHHFPEGRYRVLGFDSSGLPRVRWPEGRAFGGRIGPGDRDGDGRLDPPLTGPRPAILADRADASRWKVADYRATGAEALWLLADGPHLRLVREIPGSPGELGDVFPGEPEDHRLGDVDGDGRLELFRRLR